MRAALREIFQTILLALLIFLAVKATFQTSEVQLSSMEPNIHPGQYLVVNKAVYFSANLGETAKLVPFLKQKGDTVFLFHPPQRGEIIVFHPPVAPSQDYIKRVIATPGEIVEIKDGKVYIDGTPLEEPYISDLPHFPYGPKLVPQDHYFVLGDNRNGSSDSRHWGTVPRQNIVGNAWLCYWPPNEWELVPNHCFKAAEKQVLTF